MREILQWILQDEMEIQNGFRWISFLLSQSNLLSSTFVSKVDSRLLLSCCADLMQCSF